MLCQLQLRYHNVLVFLAVGVQDCVVLSNTLCHLGNYEIVPPVLLPLLTQQQISLFVCWRGRLHWVLLVTPLWALIPWRNIHMCNFERLVLIGMMHPSGCSWSCWMRETWFLHRDWKLDSRWGGDILREFFQLLLIILMRWSLMTLILCCQLLARSTGYCQQFVES